MRPRIDADADSIPPRPASTLFTRRSDEDGVQVLAWSLMGVDRTKFQLSTAQQVLSFKAKPDYEMPADANRDNVYEVTVRASDGALYVRPDGQSHRHRRRRRAGDHRQKLRHSHSSRTARTRWPPSRPWTLRASRRSPGQWWPPRTTPRSLPIGAIPVAVDNIRLDAVDFDIDKDGMLKFDIDRAQEGSEARLPRLREPDSGAGYQL